MVTATSKFKGTRAYTNVIKVAFYLVSELVFDQGGEKRIQPILRAIDGLIFEISVMSITASDSMSSTVRLIASYT